jgi:hypothetical protein
MESVSETSTQPKKKEKIKMKYMVREFNFKCGFDFNMATGSNRSFMSRFRLHCKICKSCNETMKEGGYNNLIEYRQICNIATGILKSM